MKGDLTNLLAELASTEHSCDVIAAKLKSLSAEHRSAQDIVKRAEANIIAHGMRIVPGQPGSTIACIHPTRPNTAVLLTRTNTENIEVRFVSITV